MRKITQYSAAIKASVLSKAFAPNPPRVVELAQEFNIPIGTVYTWISDMRNKQGKDLLQRPNDKTAEEKLQAVIDTVGMTEQEIGAYCRAHGIYTHHLQEWRQKSLSGFDLANDKANRNEYKQVMHENKKLKSELNKKDKALAEVSALLILKKKAELIWGIVDDEDV